LRQKKKMRGEETKFRKSQAGKSGFEFAALLTENGFFRISAKSNCKTMATVQNAIHWIKILVSRKTSAIGSA
jgi:hypothetical protein